MSTTITPESTATTFSMEAKEFARILSNASMFASKDGFRPVLKAVLIIVDGDKLHMVSTDSYALFEETATLDGNAGQARLLLSLTDAKALVKAVSKVKTGSIRL